MDIMELGAIGELVGGVAVIASLLFVGLQLRQGNVLAVAAATREARHLTDEFLRDLSTDPELSEFYFAGLANREALSSRERLRFDMILLRLFRVMENLVAEVAGGVSPELWGSYERTFASIMRQPGAAAAWARQKALFTQQFVRYVDGLLSTARTVEA